MRKKKYYLLLIIPIVLLSAGYFVIKPAFNYISVYLSKTEPVKANILIVEGWLPEYGLKTAYNEFQRNGYDYLITTGLKSTVEYFMLSEDGYLIFYTKDKLIYNGTSECHTIGIKAYSELDGEHSAHFSIFVNDSLIADYSADKNKRTYSIAWTGNLRDIDSIAVRFINDGVGDFGDRNLYVKEIIIDNETIIPYQNNTEYDIREWDGIDRLKNNYDSYAGSARERLCLMGIDSSRVLAVTSKKVRINRTLTSALAFRSWLRETDRHVDGINIISLGTHARRTWMTYNRILEKKYDIGIISIDDMKNHSMRKRKALITLRESLGT
jgi:hypothetical protein